MMANKYINEHDVFGGRYNGESPLMANILLYILNIRIFDYS